MAGIKVHLQRQRPQIWNTVSDVQIHHESRKFSMRDKIPTNNTSKALSKTRLHGHTVIRAFTERYRYAHMYILDDKILKGTMPTIERVLQGFMQLHIVHRA